MKKLLALALAVVMMMAIALPVFAADYSATENGYSETRYGDGNDDSNMPNYTLDAEDEYSNNVEIKYGVAQAYTVTIPEAFELHQWTAASERNGRQQGYVYGQQDVKVEDVVIAPGEFLYIRVDSNNTVTDLTADQYAEGAKSWILKDQEEDAGRAAADVNYQVKSYNKTAVETNNIKTWFYGTDVSELSGIPDNGVVLACSPAEGNKGTTGSSAETTLYFSSMGTAQEGTYFDTLTFKVMIVTNTWTVNN